jgi:2-polyprenyl-6-methoxyphenol hydroxylase-like FAD-dependent oxidoreductase
VVEAKTRVLIIGGGIGGLTLAVALHRRGIDAAVFEAAPELRPVGKGIWVPTNAMQVLARLGLDEAIRKAGWELERIQLHTAADGLLQDFDLAPIRQKFGHTTISIHRAALVEALAGALPSGTLHLGKRCTGVVDEQTGVTVRFDDGSDDRGDILVGADGIRSVVREGIFPGVPLRYSGQTCYRGIGDLELSPDLAHVCREVWGGAVRFGFSPIGARQAYWFAPMTALPGDPAVPSPDALAARYSAFPEPIPEIIRSTPASEIIRTDLHDFAPIRSWSKGRVVLMGDAAHAMTPNLGQGGAQAIEDAYVLAEQITRRASAEEAFREYERIRMPKVRWIVNTAWRFGQVAHWQSRPAQKFRNWMMKLTSGTARRNLDFVYSLNF